MSQPWFAGRASEDREEWMEDERPTAKECHDDDETSEVQAEHKDEEETVLLFEAVARSKLLSTESFVHVGK